MIKRTLYFGNAGYLHMKDAQLVWEPTSVESHTGKIPIEDIGVVVIDNHSITTSHALMTALMENNSVIIHCNNKHMPVGLLVAYEANTLFSQVVKAQIEASVPLCKNVWQQIIKAKIINQADNIEWSGQDARRMRQMASEVLSGDSTNMEGQAASFYFSRLFGAESRFRRKRQGEPPNHLLDYGYAILRAITARSITGSGLLGVLGLHHRNKYNPWCLADDIMEAYRPWVDRLVVEVNYKIQEMPEILSPEIKKTLLTIPVLDVSIDAEKSPLMIAMNRTTASVVKVFYGETRKILLPSFI